MTNVQVNIKDYSNYTVDKEKVEMALKKIRRILLDNKELRDNLMMYLYEDFSHSQRSYFHSKSSCRGNY